MRPLVALTQALGVICVCCFIGWELWAKDSFSTSLDRVQKVVGSYSGFDSNRDGADSTETGAAEESDLPLATDVAAQSDKDPNPEILANATDYINAILSPEASTFDLLSCSPPLSHRYDYLQHPHDSSFSETDFSNLLPAYLFALDLYNSRDRLPRLLGTLLATMRFLGPTRCVLSILEGRSTDGTYEILHALRPELETLGITYHLSSSALNPKHFSDDTGRDPYRIAALATLRNQALAPLLEHLDDFDQDATVLFINDVAGCPDDILELIHQRRRLGADMTCGMDWIFNGTSFYDVWIARTMHGEQFFEVPQDGSWDFSWNLLWNDRGTREKWEMGRPFQVFSCWNGGVAIGADVFTEGKVRFRGNREEECLLGEPVHLAKDMWGEGYGRIAVVPSVNWAYDDEEAKRMKVVRGTVGEWVERGEGHADELVEWEDEPPERIKCVVKYENPEYVAWDEKRRRRR